MALGRQRDHEKRWSLLQTRRWRQVVLSLVKRRRENSSVHVLSALQKYGEHKREYDRQLQRVRHISQSDFFFNFNSISDSDCVFMFRFRKCDVVRMVQALAWPDAVTFTKRNRYSTNPILSTCIILRRLASPTRWRDMELTFGKRSSQLSEIFWEALERFLTARKILTVGEMDDNFIATVHKCTHQ